jgi:hypothetical protein
VFLLLHISHVSLLPDRAPAAAVSAILPIADGGLTIGYEIARICYAVYYIISIRYDTI